MSNLDDPNSPPPLPEQAPMYAGVISYQNHAVPSIMATVTAIDMLRRTRPWVRFMSIMTFISSGLMVFGGLCGVVAMGLTQPNRSAGMVLLIYVPLGLIYLIPGVLLHRYANSITRMLQAQDPTSLEVTLDAQRAFWKAMGIMMIVVISLYFVIFIGAMVFGMLHAAAPIARPL